MLQVFMITYPLIRNNNVLRFIMKLCDTPTQKKYHRIPLATFTLISKKNARKQLTSPHVIYEKWVPLDTSRSTTKGRQQRFTRQV